MRHAAQKLRLVAGRPLLVLLLLQVVVSGVAGTFFFNNQATAATNSTVNFQARLMTAAGAIATDGDYNIEFKLYNASTSSGSSQGSCTGDSACKWTETRTGGNKVHVANGFVSVSLGSVTAFPTTIDWDQGLWLTMNIGGTGSPSWDGEMSPRLKLTAVPYAFRAGQLASLAGSNTAVLQFAASFGQPTTITLPDPVAGSATVCYQNSSSCGFATGTSASYIQNGTSVQTNANFAIRSAATGSVGAVIQGANGQTADLLQLQSWNGTSATTVLSVNNSGVLTLAGGQTADITTGGSALTIAPGGTNTAATLSATGTGTLTVGQSTASNTISIGSATPAASATQTINIGNGSMSNASSAITVNILSGAAGTNGTATLNLANNDRVTGVDIGNVVSDAARTLNLFTGNSTVVDTLNIGTGNTTAAGGKTIHIGDGTPSGSGTNVVTIGSISGAANTTTIQGGNGSGAVSIQAATSGTISIGNTNSNPITLGGSSGTTTLQGTLKIASITTSTNNSVALCRDTTTTNIISCATATGTGAAFVQGGNAFGATAVLGTQDAYNLQIITGSSSTVRATFDQSNGLYLGNGVTANAPNDFTVSGTGSSAAGTAGATLTIKGGAGASTSTGSVGGDIKIQGGAAGGSGNNNGGNVLLQGGLPANSGTTGGVIVRNPGDIVNAFQVQNAAASSTILNVDTLNGRVAVGGTATVSKFEVLNGDAAIYNSGNNPKLILGDSTTAGQNGYLQWDSTNDYFRIETVGTNGLKVKDNYVAIGNIFPSQPLIVGNGSSNLFQVDTTGAITAQNTSNSAFALTVKNASPTNGNTFVVDTSNSRAGVNLASGASPTLATGVAGLEVNGALRLSGTSSAADNFATISSGNVGARINVGFYTYSAGGQGIAVGVASGSDAGSRGISVFDARASGAHQPSIGVLSVDEQKIFGLSWDGGSANGYLKTNGSSGIYISPNATDAASFSTTAVSLLQNTTVANTNTFTVNGGLTSLQAGLTAYGGLIKLNDASNNNTQINTGTSTGTVTIGNSAAGAIGVTSGTSVALQTAASGNINIGSNNAANTIQIGSTTLSSGTQTINIGNNNTSGGTTDVTIGTGGSATGGTTALQAKTAVTVATNGTARATFDTSNNLFLGNGTSNASPTNFAIQGTASGTSGTAGGSLTIQGGTGNGAGAGGSVTIQGGTAGSGTKGLIQLNGSTYFTTGTFSSGSSATITQSLIDSNSAINAAATAGSLTFTVPSPTVTNTSGRILYITNNGANAFTLSFASTSFTLNTGSTATLVWQWNGSSGSWTSAGVDASTMQNVYNNSTGGTTPEILLDSSHAGIDIQDSNAGLGSTVPLLAVRASASATTLGSALFAVNNNAGAPLVGIGTATAARALHVSVSNSTTNALPVLVQQSGIGDAGLEFKNNLSSFMVGTDSSDSGKFKISSSTSSGASFQFGKVDPTTSWTTDTSDQNTQNATKFTMGSTAGTTTSISVYIVGGSSSNQFSVAIYTNDTGFTPNRPGTPVATASANIAPNTLNTVPITASLSASTTYWLAFNTNDAAANMRYETGGANISCFVARTYASGWTSPFGACSAGTQNYNIYANVGVGSSTDSFAGALLTMGDTGQTLFQNSVNSTVAFQIQNAGGNTLFGVDTSTPAVNVGITGSTAVASTLNLATSTGATQTVNIGSASTGNAAAGTTVNIQGGTGASAVVIGTNGAGNINIDSGTTGSILIGGGTSGNPAKTISIGPTATNSSATTYNFGVNTAGTQTIRLGSASTGNAAAGTTVNIQGGTGASAVVIGTNGAGAISIDSGTTGSVSLGTGANAKTVTVGSTTGASSTVVQAGSGGLIAKLGTDQTNAFQVQNAGGANQLSLDTSNTSSGSNLAATNGGGETSGTFTTQWPAAGLGTGVTVSRDTTAGEYASGTAGVKVISTTGANSGAQYNLPGGALSTSTTYVVSFDAMLAPGGTPSTFTDLDVRYNRTGTTQDALCTTGSSTSTSTMSTRTLTASVWTKITCSFITSGSAGTGTANLAIIQTASATTRTWYIDNLSIVLKNSSGTQNVGTLRVGGATSQGLTLFTLDTYAANPFTGSNSSLAGSMYFDTTSSKIQCYDGTTWGACGAAPNGIVTLTPEYAGAVLNGTGIGTMTSDFCANETGILTVGSLCANHDARNFYKWTSPQGTAQAYNMYVTYKLPSTFKAFVAGTTSLTGLVDNTSNATVKYAIFKSTGSAITACSALSTVVGWNGSSAVGTANTWTSGVAGTLSGTTDPSTCSFAAGNNVIFQIQVLANSNAAAYAENLNFQYTNQ